MKKIFTFLLILISLNAFPATKYYISTTGTDGAGVAGGIGTPWRTLAYACTRVTTATDTIWVNAGTYTETVASVLSPGVSIKGVGPTSIIHSNITANQTYTITAASTTVGTAGNQSISYIRMESGMDAYGAIIVVARSNVKIHHCTFEDFFSRGVVFIGQTRWVDGEPSTYATGNEFYNNIVTNCADYTGDGKFGNGEGNLGIGGQSGMLIYNNTIIQEDRGLNANGYPIKFYNEGYLKGVKIYNNYLDKPPYDGASWDLGVELWNCRGGMEIYNNTIKGSLDFGGNSSVTNDAGGYGFALKVHDNILGQDELGLAENNGIYLERGHTGGAYIYNNYFRNVYNAMQMYQYGQDVFQNVHIYYNIINGVGISGAPWQGNAISFAGTGTITGVYRNVNILNNAIYAGTAGQPNAGIRIQFGNLRSITIRNNVIQGFAAYPIYTQTCNFDTISVENNIFYANAGTDNTNPSYHATTVIAHKTEQNNIKTNPLFVALGTNFRPQSGSPAINAGLSIGALATMDYDSVSIGYPAEIGAYEYVVDNPAVAPQTVMYTSQVWIRGATLNGVVSNDGGGTISAKGFCWSQTPTPTPADSTFELGTGTGIFHKTISLTKNKVYYVRSYVTNEVGTAYSPEAIIRTPGRTLLYIE